jgi:hypothetical protein
MMRVVRGLVIALLTALAGCVLAVPVGDYLTKLAHVPEMEGQRGMTVFFLCVPLGIMAGLVVGVIASIVVSTAGAHRIPHCTGLVASDRLWYRRFARGRAISALG